MSDRRILSDFGALHFVNAPYKIGDRAENGCKSATLNYN